MTSLKLRMVHRHSSKLQIHIFHVGVYATIKTSKYQLRARRALSIFKDVPLRTRRALLLHKVYGDSALLVLNGTSDDMPLNMSSVEKQTVTHNSRSQFFFPILACRKLICMHQNFHGSTHFSTFESVHMYV